MARLENPSRERILARIRTALRTSAPAHSGPATAQIFHPVLDDFDCFQKQCAAVGTECYITADPKATAETIRRTLALLPPGEIFVQDARELWQLVAQQQDGRPVRWSSEGGPREATQATITLAETLIAATGSILVSAACGGRGASVVAPVHIVVARASQLVPDLAAAFAQADQRRLPLQNSYLCLISSSSRTADIQRVLVLGMHGPRRLVVIVQQEP